MGAAERAWAHARRQVSEAPAPFEVRLADDAIPHPVDPEETTPEPTLAVTPPARAPAPACNCEQALALTAQLAKKEIVIDRLSGALAERLLGPVGEHASQQARFHRLPSGRWHGEVIGPGRAWCATSAPTLEQVVSFLVRRVRGSEGGL